MIWCFCNCLGRQNSAILIQLLTYLLGLHSLCPECVLFPDEKEKQKNIQALQHPEPKHETTPKSVTSEKFWLRQVRLCFNIIIVRVSKDCQ